MLRKLIVEAIGTFFLVLTIGQVVIEPGAGSLAPLAIGAALMAMIFAGGHISGAHYNPAVTLAVLLRGKTNITEAAGYWSAQIFGAAAAALVVGVFKAGTEITPMELAVVPALLAEFVFTFALAFVILNVATARGTAGNSFYGLAIAVTVVAGAYAVGGISGGAFNPAVAVGITIMGIAPISALWIYLVACLLGGAAAALLFNALDLGDDKATTATPAEQTQLEPAANPGANR